MRGELTSLRSRGADWLGVRFFQTTELLEWLRPYLLLMPALLVIVVLFLGGLLFGLARSFNYFPLIGLNDPNVDAYVAVLTSTTFLRSVALSTYIALVATFVSMTLAIGVGLVLRENFRGSRLMTFLFQLNLPIPHIVGAIGILFLLTQGGLLSRLAVAGNLITQPADFPELVYDRWAIGIILEYVWKEVPFIGVVVLAILASIGEDYEAVAQTLGANVWQRFRYVLLPLLMPGVLSVSVIVLAFSFGSYEVPFILGRAFPQTLPIVAVRHYTNPDLRQRPQAMALAMIITLVSTGLVFLYMQLSRRLIRAD